MGYQEHQERIAKLFNGKVNKYPKGPDVISDKYIIECKQRKKSFTINESLWNKIYYEALRKGKEPMIVLELNGIDLAIIELEEVSNE